MNIVRYQRYPQSDLSVALDRLANMREEMDRVFESPFAHSSGPLPRLPVGLPQWMSTTTKTSSPSRSNFRV